MKFVILGDADGYEFPILFPIEWGHNEVVAGLAKPGHTVLAAGFIRRDGNGDFVCEGRSASLGVGVRSSRDALAIAKWLEER